MTKQNITNFPSGCETTNKTEQQNNILYKIRNSKTLKKWIVSTSLLFTTLGAMTVDAQEAEASVPTHHQEVIDINQNTTAASGNMFKMLESDIQKYGTPNPDPFITHNDNYVTSKAYEHNGTEYLTRTRVYNEYQNHLRSNAEILVTATKHDTVIINPYTNELEVVPIYFETGHTQKELNALKADVRRVLCTETGYEMYSKEMQNDVHNVPIFTAKMSRDSKNSEGYNNRDFKLIQNDWKKNYENSCSVIFHEMAHLYHDDIKSPQLFEAHARVVSFYGDLELKEKDSNYKFRDQSQGLYNYYEEYKKQNLSSDEMLLAMYCTSLMLDGYAEYYNTSRSQFSQAENDIKLIGELIPKNMQKKGDVKNFLQNVDGKELVSTLQSVLIHSYKFKDTIKSPENAKKVTLPLKIKMQNGQNIDLNNSKFNKEENNNNKPLSSIDIAALKAAKQEK